MDLATQKSLELNSQLKALAAEHDKVAGEMARLEDQGASCARLRSRMGGGIWIWPRAAMRRCPQD